MQTIVGGGGGGLNEVSSIGDGTNQNVPRSNLTNIGGETGDGVKSGVGNEDEGGLANNNPIETNEVNKVEESKMQVQQPDNQVKYFSIFLTKFLRPRMLGFISEGWIILNTLTMG